METIRKFETVYSRRTSNRGRVTRTEWEEFFHCLMHEVEFESYLNPNMNDDLKRFRKNPGYYVCWFRENDLSKTLPVRTDIEPVNEN